jgi:hypothetical protein
MRNVIQHFNDYKNQFQGVGVNTVGEVWGYFFVRYHNLVIECFNYVKNNLLHDEQFEDFLLPLQRLRHFFVEVIGFKHFFC